MLQKVDTGQMEALKIESGKTISSQIYDHLRREIIVNHLTPNTRLSEAGLCAEFGVSRQPVREVLLRLSCDKLVTINPQRGSYVSPMSLSLFHAAQFIREAVEVEVIARVAGTARPALLDALEQELSIQETFASHGDAPRFFQSDENFHALIAQECGIPALWSELRDHKIHLDRVRHLSLVTDQMMRELIVEHRQICVAIRNRDPASGQDAMRNHLRAALRKVGQISKDNPTWFMT